MNFVQIQNAVLSDRFRESQRADAINWINHRYAWIWALEDWSFKATITNVTVTANSSVVTGLPADLGTVRMLLTSDGTQLEYLTPERFYEYYYDNTTTLPGTAESFTVVNGAITIGPTSNVTKTDYRLLYDREPARYVGGGPGVGTLTAGLLSADTDVPAMPEGFHFALVHGGAAEGLKLQNDPTWQAFEQDFQASIVAMRERYLTDQRWEHAQFGSYADSVWRG